ncbi:MGMT family protein [Ornithinimicrobium sp. Arc0846-15]|nr:MGMT family protein [Ornithinimicrobium laminariae]
MNRSHSDFVDAVLAAVEHVPSAKVMTYGDVAEYIGRGHPRLVGWVMAHYGSEVAWWRVLRAGGLPPQGHEDEALEHYRDEGTPLRKQGDRVDLALARWSGPS